MSTTRKLKLVGLCTRIAMLALPVAPAARAASRGRVVLASFVVLAVCLVSTALAGASGLPTVTYSPGTQQAHSLYGYPWPNAPECTNGGACINDTWGFSQGQCVSWVAYRIRQLNGAFASYPGPGWLSAYNWGPHAQGLGMAVNGTPALGSVAWYSYGHVAYVEAVASPTSVEISEMNFDNANGFRLEWISPGNHWPNGFIHIHDRAPTAPSGSTTSPAVTTRGAGGLDVFYHGTDNQIYHYWWVNGQLAGSDLIAGLTLSSGSSLSAAANGVHPLDLFARGTDGLMYSTFLDSQGWHGWTQYPNAHLASNTSPVVTSEGAGKMDVFFHGTDDRIYQYSWQAGQLVATTQVPGVTLSSASSVGVVANGVHALDLFARGTDGLMYSNYMDSLGWHNWTQYGAQLAANSSPAVTSRGAGGMDVFFHGTDDKLYHYSWVNGQLAGSDLVAGLTLASEASVGAVANGVHPLDVFARGTDGLMYSTYLDSLGWHGWTQYANAHLA